MSRPQSRILSSAEAKVTKDALKAAIKTANAEFKEATIARRAAEKELKAATKRWEAADTTLAKLKAQAKAK